MLSGIPKSQLWMLIEQKRPASLFSQMWHFLRYSIKKTKTPSIAIENGMLIISVDVDVGSRELGIINQGRYDTDVNRFVSESYIGEIEELALSVFVKEFDELEIPVTFAIRGQLTEVDCAILEPIIRSSIDHDVGAHGYYHREFTKLSPKEADQELNMVSAGLKRLGVFPRTFVFPANSVAHLNLLEKFGYKCYRGYGDLVNDSMCVERQGELYNVHPSLYINQHTRWIFLRRILDVSIERKLPFHIWFHLWNFGDSEKSIEKTIKRVLLPFLSYAKDKEKRGMLSLETMLSASLKVEKVSGNDATFP